MILARIAQPVGVTGDFNLSITVEFFDDNDPENVGVTAGYAPRNILQRASFTYAATLTGTDLQNALKVDVKTRLALFTRGYEAAADAKVLVPVGALITPDS